MPGPAPKDPRTRRRTNKASTAAKLPAESKPRKRTPELPKGRTWHARTKAWWKDVWASPMASQFLDSDVHELLLLAVLVDAFWEEPSKELAAEIRLQRRAFGLSPIDRRGLHWQVEGAGAGKVGARSKAEANPSRGDRDATAEDPRRHLAAVK